MAIWATLLNENNDEIGEWFSTAIFTFCTDALNWYCARAELSHVSRDEFRDVIEWFAFIAQNMTESLCWLHQATLEPWEYTEDEYARYLNEYVQGFGPPPISQSQFVKTCRKMKDESPWIDINKMIEVVNELLNVLKEQQPEETWWYSEEATIPDFEEMIQVLTEAKQVGVEQMRFGWG